MKFVHTEKDSCLCVKIWRWDRVIIVVHVNDILIDVKIDIANCFEAKAMGELHYYWGVKIFQDLKAVAYSEDILWQFNMQDAKSCKPPVNPSLKLTKANEQSLLSRKESRVALSTAKVEYMS